MKWRLCFRLLTGQHESGVETMDCCCSCTTQERVQTKWRNWILMPSVCRLAERTPHRLYASKVKGTRFVSAHYGLRPWSNSRSLFVGAGTKNGCFWDAVQHLLLVSAYMTSLLG